MSRFLIFEMPRVGPGAAFIGGDRHRQLITTGHGIVIDQQPMPVL